MKRPTILLAAALLLSACGSTARHVVSIGPFPRFVAPAPPSPTALRFSTASNRSFAHQDVQKLIRILMLPHGARLVAKVPRGAPSRFRTDLTRPQFVPGTAVTRRIWIVHEPLARVVRFVQTHALPRPRPEARFRGENNGVRLHTTGSYAFPPVPGRVWGRWLNADMIALSGGGTAVIAQAGDAWNHTPRSVLLPRAVKRIDVLSRIGNQPPNVLVHVREPYEVGSIVSLMNGLGLADAEHIVCLADFWGGPTVTLRFRAADGKLLAHATVPDPFGSGSSGPCDPLQLTVHGRKAPPLIGAGLLLRLQQSLDVDLAPPLPRDVQNCLLRRRGWRVQSVTHTGMVDRVQTFPSELTATKNGKLWTITFHYTGKVTLDKAGPRGLERCLRAGRRYVIAG